jgi:hypothetical protein
MGCLQEWQKTPVYLWDFNSSLIFTSTEQEELQLGSGVYNTFLLKCEHGLRWGWLGFQTETPPLDLACSRLRFGHFGTQSLLHTHNQAGFRTKGFAELSRARNRIVLSV